MTKLTDQFNILNDLKADGAHPGIDDRSKVRYLLNAVQCPDLSTVKTSIMANPKLGGDFPQCVSLFKQFILNSKLSKSNNLHIAKIESDKTKPSNQKNKNKTKSRNSSDSLDQNGKRYKITSDKVENKYYENYHTDLSPEAKRKLYEMQQSRTPAPNRARSNGRDRRGGGNNTRFNQREVSAIAAAAARAINAVHSDDRDEHNDDDADSATTTRASGGGRHQRDSLTRNRGGRS